MRTGTSVWIDVPLEDLAMRVVSAGIGSRPILSEGTSLEMDLFTQVCHLLLFCRVFWFLTFTFTGLEQVNFSLLKARELVQKI